MLSMLFPFMCLELGQRVITTITLYPSVYIELITRIRPPMEMLLIYVFLESGMFSEILGTRWETCATELFSSLMCLLVSA